MSIFAIISVITVAIIHITISVVEIFFWNNPLVYQRIDYTAEIARKVAPIVQNARLYNGFIAAGLIWAVFSKNNLLSLRVFFLVCAVIAGIFGALTLKLTTLVLQTLPAFIALIIIWLAHSRSNTLVNQISTNK